MRLMHEAKLHDGSSFITLTFKDEALPDDWSLDIRYWQLFRKALRHRVGSFRYYGCGEYGGLHGRPHFHAALFGVDFREDRERIEDSRSGHPQYVSPTLDAAWKFQGRATISELTFESACYIAGYVRKKVTGEKADDHYWSVDETTGEANPIKPEFSFMSRRPGIGAGYFERYGRDVYPRDEVIARGAACKPPRYYDKLLEKEDPAALESVKERRRLRAKRREADGTDDRLAVREEVARRRTSSWKREFT